MKRLVILVTAVSLTLSGVLVAGATTNPKANTHASYALGSAKKCRVNFVKTTERHKVKGKNVRYVVCVYHSPAKSLPVTQPSTPQPLLTTPTTQPSTPSVTTTTLPKPSPRITAALDPTFTQDASNPLKVTWDYSASITDGTLPTGTLTLTVTVHNHVASSGGCLLNVSGLVTGGLCTVTVPAFGQYDVTVSYSGGGNIAASGETQTDTISQFSSSVTFGTATVGSATVNGSNNYAVLVTIPVTISGQTVTPSGTISGTGLSCTVLTAGAGSCTKTVENATNASTVAATITYSGDTNYSSSGATSAGVVIPAAPAPTVTNVTPTLACSWINHFCSQYDSSAQTTGTYAEVLSGGVSPNVGTVTFTSSDHRLVCVATVNAAISNNARCTNTTENTQFSGPLSVVYSGGTVFTGNAYKTIYAGATTSGGSN